MNPTQLLINQLKNQLKMKNPQALQIYEQARKSNNPQELLNNITNNYNAQQITSFKNFVRRFGVPDEYIDKLGINTNSVDIKK